MNVTVSKLVDVSEFDSRNEPEISFEQWTAGLKALLSTGDPVLDEKIKRARVAAYEGQSCSECGRSLAPDEPVWRRRWNLFGVRGFGGGYSWTVSPFCQECKKSPWGGWADPKPCEGCGRPVYHERRWWRWWHVLCSDRCARAFHVARSNAKAKARRTAAREGKTCQVCQRLFTPSRLDATTCSSACRQRAYRQRRNGRADT